MENLLLDGGDGDLLDGGDSDLLDGGDGLRGGGGDGNLLVVQGLGAVFSIAPRSGEDAKETNRLVAAAARLIP